MNIRDKISWKKKKKKKALGTSVTIRDFTLLSLQSWRKRRGKKIHEENKNYMTRLSMQKRTLIPHSMPIHKKEKKKSWKNKRETHSS